MMDMDENGRKELLRKYGIMTGAGTYEPRTIARNLDMDPKKLRNFMRQNLERLKLQHGYWERWALSEEDVGRIVLALKDNGKIPEK